ncbi:MAG: hypothetical protein R3C68_07635 [Myxococcota bacterium]
MLAEFATETTRVLLHNLRDQQTQSLTMAQLLPHAFLSDHLRDSP